jgi:hypothetical protein
VPHLRKHREALFLSYPADTGWRRWFTPNTRPSI